LAGLFSSFLTCASFREGKIGDESDCTGATLQFCEQMSQVASTGSWLNMVEIELSVLVNQCLKQRIGEIGQLREEIVAWEQARNTQKVTVQWRFTPPDARIKLKHLYPSHEEGPSSDEAKRSIKSRVGDY
jgi:hypothetical protein